MNTFNHDGAYQCVCGRTFTKSLSFNAHKSQCKLHLLLKYGNDNDVSKILRRESGHDKLIACCQRSHEEAVNRKQILLELWIAEQHTCEKCGKIMTEKFGSGRFCSRVCSNSRTHTEELKNQISNSLTKFWNEYFRNISIDTNKSHRTVKTKSEPSYKDALKGTLGKQCYSFIDDNGELMVKYFGREDTVPNGWIKGNLRRKYKILLQVHDVIGEYAIEQPKYNAGYLHCRRSYAELFWKSVLDNNSIEYIELYPIKSPNKYGTYRLDFYIESKRLDLEIDGELHELCEDKDILRTEYLKSLGILTYRVKWVNPDNDKRSLIVKQLIDDFIAYFNAL